MRKKLDYDQLTRLDTHIHKDLRAPLYLVKFLKDTTIVEITNNALEGYLGAELEGVYEEMCKHKADNPNNVFRDEVIKWLKIFDRL